MCEFIAADRRNQSRARNASKDRQLRAANKLASGDLLSRNGGRHQHARGIGLYLRICGGCQRSGILLEEWRRGERAKGGKQNAHRLTGF